MSFRQLFESRPSQWGLRGDPYIWDLIEWELWAVHLPRSQAERERLIRDTFADVTGMSLDAVASEIYVPDIPSGGMSGGMVSLQRWRAQVMPFIMEASNAIASPADEVLEPVHPATHRFKFAAWAAARAASSSKDARFKVRFASRLLKTVPGLYRLALGATWLPKPEDFDRRHHEWCTALIELAALDDTRPTTMSYGVAAKLVNCYTKALFLPQFGEAAEPHIKARIDTIHPPIDRLLLKELAARKVGGRRVEWRSLHDKGWSNFDEADYRHAIDLIRDVTGGELWTIEAYWSGYLS
jgi:hypothetical protein